tara:strand:- start:184 stop:450 length:267 start_codon:yes stop_codon:yes gene_type:complete
MIIDRVQDSYMTWCAQLARSFGAEIHVQAVSGWGVGSGATAIQTILDYTNGFAKEQRWDYTSWTPDAVVSFFSFNSMTEYLSNLMIYY